MLNILTNKLNCRSFAELLLLLAILLVPYDGIPILPMTYRPVSIFPLVALVPVLLINYRGRCVELGRKIWPLPLILCIFVVISFIKSSTGNFLEATISLLLAAIGIYSIAIVSHIKIEREGVDTTVNWLINLVAVAYLIPVFIGLIELASLSGFVDGNVFNTLSGIFGGWQFDRIFLTSREASWASVHLLFAMCAYAYCASSSRGRLRRLLSTLMLALSLILFVFTKSLQGVLVVAAGFLFFALWYILRNRNVKTTLIVIAGIVAVFVTGYFILRAVMSLQPGYYYAQRFLNFTNVINLIKTDSSSFIRITSPLICLLMMVEHFPIGIGGCMYSAYYSNYIVKYFPWALSFPEVVSRSTGLSEASPFCLYTRLCAEYGIFGLILIVLLIRVVVRVLKQVDVSDLKRCIAVFFCMVLLACPLQFDSYFYIPFTILVGLIIAANYSEEYARR